MFNYVGLMMFTEEWLLLSMFITVAILLKGNSVSLLILRAPPTINDCHKSHIGHFLISTFLAFLSCDHHYIRTITTISLSMDIFMKLNINYFTFKMNSISFLTLIIKTFIFMKCFLKKPH